MAVIHADGNDLGKNIMKMAQDGPEKEAFRDLSVRIGKATEQAARKAFEQVVKRNTKEGDLFPFRPIVLGGDDLTVIIRGDLAIDFTQAFLQAFEEETIIEFKGFVSPHFHTGLTACAGIAYVKVNYPFHYGVHLAEALCAQAKKVAKGMRYDRTPSCLLFHKVHSSFIDDYKSVIDQEFRAGQIRLDYGPYFLSSQNGYATINELIHWVEILKEDASPKSRLRNWLSELQINQEVASQQLDRIKAITSNRYVRELKLDKIFERRTEEGRNENIEHTHLFDAIILSSI
ncbi:MAG: hypothetical protein IPH16_13890 [Haliscomenobacter sp.]|nr:hypothetical protein [Haliscomenobacter sp.]